MLSLSANAVAKVWWTLLHPILHRSCVFIINYIYYILLVKLFLFHCIVLYYLSFLFCNCIIILFFNSFLLHYYYYYYYLYLLL